MKGADSPPPRPPPPPLPLPLLRRVRNPVVARRARGSAGQQAGSNFDYVRELGEIRPSRKVGVESASFLSLEHPWTRTETSNQRPVIFFPTEALSNPFCPTSSEKCESCYRLLACATLLSTTAANPNPHNKLPKLLRVPLSSVPGCHPCSRVCINLHGAKKHTLG